MERDLFFRPMVVLGLVETEGCRSLKNNLEAGQELRGVSVSQLYLGELFRGTRGWSPWIAMGGVLGVGLAMQAAGSLATANGLLVERCSGARLTQKHASFCLFGGTLQNVAIWHGVKRSRSERGFLGPRPWDVPDLISFIPTPAALLPALPPVLYVQLPARTQSPHLPINGPLEWSSGFGRGSRVEQQPKWSRVRLPTSEAKFQKIRDFRNRLPLFNRRIELVGELFAWHVRYSRA